MSGSILTTSGIDSLISAYQAQQNSLYITPLKTVQNKYQSLSSSYSTITSKLNTFVSGLSGFTATDSSSIFAAVAANSSDTNFVSATADTSASVGNYDIRVEQLAKSDIAISQSLASDTANSITGTHTFQITTGSTSGDLVSNVSVTFGSGETNQTVMQKISDAINSNQAVVTSQSESSSSSYAGAASTISFDVGGTTTTVSVNSGGSGSETYDQILTDLVQNINSNVSGVTAQKVTDPNNSANEMLQITVNDTSKSISISDSSGTLASDLGITTSNLIAASGVVTASAFTPSTGLSQLSITSKNSGLDNIIKNISDTGSGTALSSVNFNLGTSRTTFDQSANTAGYVYSDTTLIGNQLNAKLNFNGLEIQRDSNSISDLASGITFKLNSVMQSSDPNATVTVSSDTTSITSQINTFITNFNDLYKYLKTNSAVSDSSGRGVLSGDTNASSILNIMSQASIAQVSGLSANALNLLSSIGISFDSTNGLSISDSSLLTQSLKNNLPEVKDLFNSTNGIANTLYNSLNPYVGSTGFLTSEQSAFDTNVQNYSDRISTAQTSITKRSDALRTQYEKLQAQLVDLTNTAQTYFGVNITDYFNS
jgi:flagellar hook-associated protein 2